MLALKHKVLTESRLSAQQICQVPGDKFAKSLPIAASTVLHLANSGVNKLGRTAKN